MKDEILREKFKNLSGQQISWINEYSDNDMQKLKMIVHPICSGYNLPVSEYGDVYDKASDVLIESVFSYDENKDANFKTFLVGNIKRKIITWYRDNYQTGIRKNLLRDKDGRIIFETDSNGKKKPIIIPDVPFDTPQTNDEEISLKEKIASDFDMDNQIIEDNENPENVKEYLKSLGKTERKIAEMIIDGYTHEEIQGKLNISAKVYASYIADMKCYNKKRILKPNFVTKTMQEDMNMSIQLATSENKKDTSYSLAAIIKKLEKNKLRDNHVLQRESGQWKAKAKSELISDILQGNSLTPIIISEEIKNGMAMHWLIDGKQRCTNIHDFAGDGFAISKNVQIYNIEYLTDKVDENGNVVYNEDGFPIPEIKTFNIRNKKFSQLPEELQDKFLEYQLPVMMNLNCTKRKIAYDIARFNRCRPMNVAQNGWTGLDEVYAEYVDNILKMDFFNIDNRTSSYTKGNKTSGAMRRMIVEAIITSQYIEEFNKDFRAMCEFLTEEANESVFIEFYTIVDRLSSIVTEETSELFNTKNSFLWFALFDKFTTYDIDDKKFQEFLVAFVNGLKDKAINNITYTELDENKTTKDKSVVKTKMNHLTVLMEEFLHIKSETKEEVIELENNKVEDDVEDTELLNVNSESEVDHELEFVRKMVDPKKEDEDIEIYQSFLDDWIKVDSHVYKVGNAVLLALTTYACDKNQDEQFGEWLDVLEEKNNVYTGSEEERFNALKAEFDNFVSTYEDKHNNPDKAA